MFSYEHITPQSVFILIYRSLFHGRSIKRKEIIKGYPNIRDFAAQHGSITGGGLQFLQLSHLGHRKVV